MLERLGEEEGFYVPSLRRDSTLVRAKMGKRADFPPPATYVLTPSTEMSNKFLVEVSRGCPTLCRFCWAGYNYLPKRSFEVQRILDVARGARQHTEQIGLVSTAVGAHKEIVPLMEALQEMGYRISVSSLRFEDLRAELLDPISKSGEKTLAVAPEVGTDRLRFAIHKRVTNEQILEKTELIFGRGIENLKLYLMVGLPTECDEDIDGIIDLVGRIREQLLAHGRRRGRVGRLIPSVNPFIPKPGTPFQWHAMEKPSLLARKMQKLKKAFARMPNVEANFKSARLETLQALLSVGDKHVAPVLIRIARGEADLKPAMKEAGLDLDAYIYSERSPGENLPWGYIDNGMKPELLESQYDKAQAAASLRSRPLSQRAMFVSATHGGVELLLSEQLSREGVPHGFTSRTHGFGARDRGERDREQLSRALKLSRLAYMKQVHGRSIRTIDGNDDVPECDGVTTTERDLGLIVHSADCVPLLFWASDVNAVAAVHAGWRGL